MRASCISHPAKDRLIIIRSWQLLFCDGNYCAAALLSYFEYLHNGLISKGEDESTPHRIKAENISRELLGLYSRDAIREARSILVAKGAVTELSSSERHSNDQTMGFRLHPEVIKTWMESKFPDAENRISDAENRNCSVAENRNCKDKVLIEEEKGLSIPTNDISPQPGGGFPERKPFYEWKTFRDAYPKHRMLPSQEREAKDFWNTSKFDQDTKNSIVVGLLRLVVSKAWMEHEGRYIPAPKKFLEERYWEHDIQTEIIHSIEAEDIRKKFLEITGERESLHAMTPGRREMLAARYLDALAKTSNGTREQAFELIFGAIEGAATSHEKRKVPKRLTLESIFETTEKFERWLAEVYA